jgi:hypothetical protein
LDLLPPDAQLLSQGKITRGIISLQISQVTPAFSHQLDEASSGGFIMFVNLQMFRKLTDAMAENGNLNLGGSGIILVTMVFSNYLILRFLVN